jgi:DNA polymerase III subunit delta
LYGPDTFSRGEALRDLCRRLDSDGMLETNTTTFDGRSLKSDELLAACDTVPFLAAARLVLVEGLLGAQESIRASGRASTGRGRATTAVKAEGSSWAGLPEYLGRMPPTTQLVLIDGDLNKSNWLLAALRAAVEGHSELFEERRFEPPRGEILAAWIERRAKAIGAVLQPRAVAVLAETVGPNLWQLSGEIEKLSLYAYGRPIEVADVRRLVSTQQTATVFQLVDAVMAGQGDEALRAVRVLLDDGAAGPYLLTMLANQFRQVLLAQDLMRRGVQRPEIMSKLNIRHDFVLRKLLDQARRFPAARVEAGHMRILEADLNIKRGIQDEETAVELLVADLAHPA